MSQDILLDRILNELKLQGTPPLAIHVDATGLITYVVYGAQSVQNYPHQENVTGYPVLRISEPTTSHTYIDKGFLLETDRVAGANGSAANVNLKTDYTNALLLLENPALIYG